MEYALKDGASVDDSYFEKLSEAAAKGDYLGEPGEWLLRPQGRPRLCDENLVSVTFKVLRSQYEAISKKAKSLNESRGEYPRRAIVRDLSVAV